MPECRASEQCKWLIVGAHTSSGARSPPAAPPSESGRFLAYSYPPAMPPTYPPPLPRWFGPRSSSDDPAVAALIERVARGAEWEDIGGAFNLNVRIDAQPPVLLRVHRPWVTRGRVAGLRRLRERLQQSPVRVAQP